MNKDRPVLSATELWPIKCTFQQCIDYVDIAGRYSARRRQTRVHGMVKTRYVRAKCVNISKTIGDASKITIND